MKNENCEKGDEKRYEVLAQLISVYFVNFPVVILAGRVQTRARNSVEEREWREKRNKNLRRKLHAHIFSFHSHFSILFRHISFSAPDNVNADMRTKRYSIAYTNEIPKRSLCCRNGVRGSVWRAASTMLEKYRLAFVIIIIVVAAVDIGHFFSLFTEISLSRFVSVIYFPWWKANMKTAS